MGTKSAEPADQLLVKVSPQRQRPTANLFKGLSRKREASGKLRKRKISRRDRPAFSNFFSQNFSQWREG